MKASAFRTLSVMLFVVSLAGCSANFSTEIDIDLPPLGNRATIVEKLPIAVGVYFSPQFRKYSYTWNRCRDLAERQARGLDDASRRCDLDLHVDIGNLGAASVTVIERAMTNLFDRVETLDTPRPAQPGKSSLAGIVEPEMLPPIYRLLGGTVRFSYGATVRYRLILRSPTGAELAGWPVSGETREQIEGITFVTTGVRDATHRALRAVEAKILTEFRDSPEVRRWLAHAGEGGPSR